MRELSTKLAEAAHITLWSIWDAKAAPAKLSKKDKDTAATASKTKTQVAGTQQSTQHVPSPEPLMADAAWKSRASMLAEVLTIYLESNSCPLEVLPSLKRIS